jgi:hypothetical protein
MLTRDKEWKNKYAGYHTTYSMLVYIVTSTVKIYGLYELVRFLFSYCKTNTALKSIAPFITEYLGLTTEAT